MNKYFVVIRGLVVTFFLLTGIHATAFGKPNKLSTKIFSGLKLRGIGPALMSGRISDIQIHPKRQSTWYVAVGSGGVWKTTNAGTTWTPIFDQQKSYSIGCICLDPNHPETVWVGTGENVSGRHVGFGDGVYKSLDGGKTWQNMGLTHSEHIGKILVDPRDSNLVYVAAEGPLWSAGGDRGLFKSADGGKSWKPSLIISKDTGITDVEFDPENPDILYAAAYQRRRSVAAFMGGGPESDIYKTQDAGVSWKKLKQGLPKVDMGKIALAVSLQNPNVVYASIETAGDQGGFFRSTDKGESFTKRSDYFSGGTGAHYYQEIYADPHQFDRVYQMDAQSRITNDGGKSFKNFTWEYRHGDDHAMAFDPRDPDYLLIGTDGGLYESWDRGKTYKYVANLPVTQFYRLAIDNATPFYYVHGGTQDNGSQLGPSRTLSNPGIVNSDWIVTYGADGYACAIDPSNPNIIYVSWQNGNLIRYDKKSGEKTSIRPMVETGSGASRWNWDSPLLLSPHRHTRLYYGSERLYRSDDRGDSWRVISPDLTRKLDRYRQPILEKTWGASAIWDHLAMSHTSTLTTITESPIKESLLYVGTDDGLVQISENGGKTWRRIDRFPGVPKHTFVNDLRCSELDADTVFAAFDNHKRGDFKPYLLKSTDRGQSWKSIAGDLPDRHIIWAVVQDHKNENLLFAATELGLFFTIDGGKHWNRISGAPAIAFRDLEIQKRESDLVGASFGRGIYILDDYTPLRMINSKVLQQEAVLFPVRKALQYVPKQPLGQSEKATQGHTYYVAKNPPFGAIFTYYLRKGIKTRKQLRENTDRTHRKKDTPVTFPSWEELRHEEDELKPKVLLAIYDQEGNLVRRLKGPTGKGFHRIGWDLRYPPIEPTRLKEKKRLPWEPPPRGPQVVPGTFQATLFLQAHGTWKPLSKQQTFLVESLDLASLLEKDRKAKLAFQKQAGQLQRAMMGTLRAAQIALKQLKFIRKALIDTPRASPELVNQVHSLRERILQKTRELTGEKPIRRMHRPTPPGLIKRLSVQHGSTSPITGTDRQNLSKVSNEFATLSKKLHNLINIELKVLQEKLEEIQAPWTPGRQVPVWSPDQK